jgi:hypothetical protein
MQQYITNLIKQIQAKLAKNEADSQYFQGALDAFLLIEAELKHNVEHNLPDGETTETEAAEVE